MRGIFAETKPSRQASFIHYPKRLYDFAKEPGGIVPGNAKLLSEIVWPHFWALQIILLIIILNHCVIRELGRVLGERGMIRMFFQHPGAANGDEREVLPAPVLRDAQGGRNPMKPR